jgi:3-oxoacyl-[acyl-carrier protein] reductase/bacilysin biosynthesis oxidoreductase BacG
MLDLGLSGKTAIVTGGSAGIGLASAKALFNEGAKVVIAANDQLEKAATSIKELSEEKRESEVVAVDADLAKAGSAKLVVKTAIDRFGKVDILVNCAGAARAGAFLELSDQDFLDAWTLKLLGYIRMVREVAPHMIQRKDGRIVNIIGAAGRTPPPTFLPGSTANAALINFTRGISKELAQFHIRINAISPAPAETERATRLAEQTAKAKGVSIEDVIAESARSIPLGRMIKPEEIATLVLFLVSDLAAPITGSEILIDGGQTPGM